MWNEAGDVGWSQTMLGVSLDFIVLQTGMWILHPEYSPSQIILFSPYLCYLPSSLSCILTHPCNGLPASIPTHRRFSILKPERFLYKCRLACHCLCLESSTLCCTWINPNSSRDQKPSLQLIRVKNGICGNLINQEKRKTRKCELGNIKHLLCR